MKKITVDISIDNFIKLWDKAYKKKYEDIDPDWGKDIISIWKSEILKKFQLRKAGGSYGSLDDDTMRILLRSTEHTFLPRSKSYTDMEYRKKFPNAYVQFGTLRDKMGSSSPYISSQQGGEYSLKIKIPKTSQKITEGKFHSVKSTVNDPDGYMELEKKRSFIKSSFVLTWPKILKRTMEGMK